MGKRRIIYDDDDENPVLPPVVKKPKRRPSNGADKPTDKTNPEEPSMRRSSRSSKGTGGQLARMQELERIQTERSTRPSKLDLATQGEDINPMAPSSQGVGSRNSRGKEKAVVNPSEIRESPPPLSSFSPPQPVFSRAAPGQQFGFRLPDTQAPVRRRFSVANSGTSSRTSTPSASLFSGRSGITTAPTSRASSICSSVGQRTYAQAVQQPSPPSQRANNKIVPLSSREHSNTNRPSIFDDSDSTPETEDTRSHTKLSRTASFYHLPLSADAVGHSLLAAPRPIDEGLQIDEVSPSEDDRFAEETLRQGNGTWEPKQYEADTVDTPVPWPYGSTEASRAVDQAEDERNDAPRPSSSAIGRSQVSSGHSFRADMMSSRPQAIVSANAVDQMEDVAAHREYNRDPRRPDTATAHRTQVSSSRRSDTNRSTNRNVSRYSQPIDDHGSQTEDVVASHRERNHAPRLPSGSQLLATRRQQVSSHHCSTTHDSQISWNSASPSSDAAAPQPSGEDASVSQFTTHNATPIGPATEGADPWQLQYYDPPARDIIERAKQFSHCDAATINAFPVRANFNLKSIEYIEEAIVERRSRGLVISQGWWPQHSSGITRLLWEDLCNWRSALRKKARAWVTQRYDWDSEHRRERNVEIAKALLGGGGVFLRDGYDEEGHVNNLSHPALSGLIIDFFYTGPTSVGVLFPEVFKKEVPRVCVAIAATALKVVLDEMITAQAEVNFKVSIYSPVYTEILSLMDKCDSSDVHRVKTMNLRKEWARLGSSGVTNLDLTMTNAGGFDVDLA